MWYELNINELVWGSWGQDHLEQGENGRASYSFGYGAKWDLDNKLYGRSFSMCEGKAMLNISISWDSAHLLQRNFDGHHAHGILLKDVHIG